MPTDWDRERAANIQRNKALLAALAVEKPAFEPKQKKRPAKAKAKASAKRPASEATDEEDDEEPPRKAARVVEDAGAGGPRRSGRNAGRAVDYTGESEAAARRNKVEPVSVRARRESNYGGGPEGREDGRRTQNPKKYGAIPGIEVGTWWQGRKGCSVDAVHAPLVAGITAGPQGAYSVAMSGGYDDDVDEGYAFTYTGSGGRDLKGTKQQPKNLRTAPQSKDQDFENPFNHALKVSAETKKPVRVIRGFKCKSKYAPAEGYRYDGLYVVEKAWRAPGLNDKGFLVCKYIFKRLPGQPPLEVRDDLEGEEAPEGDAEEEEAEEEAEEKTDEAEEKEEKDDGDKEDTEEEES